MPQSEFEFSESLAEYVLTVTKRLEASGVDRALIDDVLSLPTLVQILAQRDDDQVDYLNAGLSSGSYHVSAIAGTTVTTGAAGVALAFEVEDLVTLADVTWVVGSPTRVTFSNEGLYSVSAGLSWAATATGSRGMEVRKNGAALAPEIGDTAPASATRGPKNSVAFEFQSTGGDYLEVLGWQDSGANKTATGYMHVAYLGTLD